MQMKVVLLSLILVSCSYSQNCLNHAGSPVDWLLLLHSPASLNQGYLYFDSNTTASAFKKYDVKPDTSGHPIDRTLSQINTLGSVDYVAWND
jgi:hypothetical protein